MDPQSTPTPAAVGPLGVTPSLSNAAGRDTTLSDALLTIRKRKWVIAVALVLGLAYGYYKGVTQPRIYEAAGRIEIRSGSSNQYRVGTSATTGMDNVSSRIPTEVAILQSDTLLLTVAKDLDLANNPSFWGAKGPVPHVSLDDLHVRQNVVGVLGGNVHVTALPKTDIIRISYTGTEPNLCSEIVNTLVEEYRNRTLNSRYEATQRTSNWLSGRLSGLQKQVEQAQERVLDLQKRLGVLGFDPSHNQITSNLEEFSRASATAEITRILAQSRYDVLRGGGVDLPELTAGTDAGYGGLGTGAATAGTSAGTAAPGTGTTPGTTATGGTLPSPGGSALGVQSALSSLRSQLTNLQANYQQLLQGGLGPNHPQARALRAQMDEIQRAMDRESKRELAQSKQIYVAARTNEHQINSVLEAQKAEADKLRDDLVRYTLAQRQYESDRTLYEGLLQRIQSASVQAGLESQEIDTIDPATPPPTPSLQPRSSLLIMYGTIALVIGVIGAFVLESLDTGLHSVAEVEAATGLASLALIPRPRKSPEQASLTTVQRNILVVGSPKSQFAEAFRALRTSLLLSSAGHPPTTILLTSATPSEGKTTISTNLASVLAQRNVRVLLIDADLRRPTVHHRFGLNGRVGLTTVLTGSCTAEEAIQHVADIPNLDILPSGPVPPFPTEMLSSSTMMELLKRFEQEYTHVVIDSPPLLSVTDGVVLAREADAVVLIVRHGKSSRQAVRRARDLVLRSGAPLTGIVLNAVDLNSPEYYGYYGYSGYGYAYPGVDTESWTQRVSRKKNKEEKEEVDRA